ncbi:hypothetical protein AB4Z22_46520, partial [Paenibacillus sp. TAF58]
GSSPFISPAKEIVDPLKSVTITNGAQSVTVNDQLTFNSVIKPSSVTVHAGGIEKTAATSITVVSSCVL